MTDGLGIDSLMSLLQYAHGRRLDDLRREAWEYLDTLATELNDAAEIDAEDDLEQEAVESTPDVAQVYAAGCPDCGAVQDCREDCPQREQNG
jgi:hypothetical protein